MDAPTRAELERAHCWEADDRVPRRPGMTAFRQRARLHQAQWREAHSLPIGTQPIVPRDGRPSRPVGSRLPLDDARERGANFLTDAAFDAARTRLARKEARQSVDAQRVWADLLSSAALAFNLFGDLAADVRLADRAVHHWWPDTPGTVAEVRFLHSPGWLDPAYIGSLVAFDAVFVLDLGDGTRGCIAVDTKYHERAKPETPKPARLARYRAVARQAGVFRSHADRAVNGTELTVMWLEHLLLLSMLQHVDADWRWGRYAVMYPAANTDVADACSRYGALLEQQSGFAPMTLEALLDAPMLPPRAASALRDRYCISGT